MKSKRLYHRVCGGLLVLVLSAFSVSARAAAPVSWSTGQTIYVPAYSHVYMGDREKPFYLTATVSIRNSDPLTTITVTSVDYHDSAGRLIRKFLKVPLLVRPYASLRYIVNESDKEGGSGASFIVTWKSAAKVSQPIVESVMIGVGMQQGISFTSRGQVVRESAP
jgi:hypothetical protein